MIKSKDSSENLKEELGLQGIGRKKKKKKKAMSLKKRKCFFFG